jgi:copper(I)-binding protein
MGLRARLASIVSFFAFLAALAGARAGGAPLLEAKNPWVRAPVAGQPAVAAYMELVSAETAALVAVTSPVAARVEIHRTALEGGVMRMRPVERLELPAGQPVRLVPGGVHLMLMELARPLKPGEKVPLRLVVERPGAGRSVVSVEAEVRAGAGAPHSH